MLGTSDGVEYARVVLFAVFQQRDAIARHPVGVHNPRLPCVLCGRKVHLILSRAQMMAYRSELPHSRRDSKRSRLTHRQAGKLA